MNATLSELLRQNVLYRFAADAFRHLPPFRVAMKLQTNSLFYSPNDFFHACVSACFDYFYESIKTH